jgi:phage tail sheath protein FI
VTPTYPGVYIQELTSPVHTIAGVATSITAFVGYTARGIDNRAEAIFSFSDYERLFGGLATDSELSYAVQQFFGNGGTQAYVVRAPRAGATGAQVVLDSLLFTALSSGSWADGNLLLDVDYNNVSTSDATAFNLMVTNLVDGTVETFSNVSLNTAKQNYVVKIVNDPSTGSQLVKVSLVGPPPASPPAISGVVGKIINPGSIAVALSGAAITGTAAVAAGSATVTGTGTSFNTALQVGQSVVFGADTTFKQYQVQSIASDTSLTLTTNYTGTPAPTSNISALRGGVTKAFGLKLSVSFPTTAPAPLPLAITVFPQNSIVPQSISGLAAQLQRAINSALAVSLPGASVTCSVSTGATGSAIRLQTLIPQFPDAVAVIQVPDAGISDAGTLLGLETPASANVAHYAFGTGHGTGSGWGGQQTSSVAGSDGTGLPGTGELIGDPSLFSGIYALDKVDLFNLLCIPDATRANPGNPSALDIAVDPNSIFGAAIALCDRRRAFLLIDVPPNVNTPSAAVDYKTSGLAVHDPNGAVFFPRLNLADPLNSFQLRTFAPCGVVAGLYARIDASRGVWKAPAGTEATLSGVQGMVYKLNDPENGELNPLGLNCFRTFPVYGSVLWGARTLVGADADANQWKYVPVRRIALFIEETLYRGTQWVVFEPNDEPLWAAIRLNVGSFMQDLFRKEAFQGMTPADAYFVKCDSETTTQSDINNGIVNILVGFAPLKPAEFVVIQIEQLAGQSQA